MRCIKLTLAYDGTQYCGWQVQRSGQTVQGVVEDALSRLTGSFQRVTASGRTDSGVHALGQVASFETSCELPIGAFVLGLNTYLPLDVRILRADEVPRPFDPIRDAKSKRYRYQVQDGPIPDVFQRRFAWYQPGSLDLDAMIQAAAILVGEHDFAAFQTSGSPRATTTRHVRELTVERSQSELSPMIRIEIESNGFLYNMVRNIVGTLVLVGKGRHPWTWVQDVLQSRDRRCAGPTAPPQGLFLLRVTYNDR